MSCPEVFSCFFKVVIKSFKVFHLPEMKKIMSLAKLSWFTCGPLISIKKTWFSRWLWSLLRDLDNTCAPKINRARERGSPCLIPLVKWKKPCLLPLTMIENSLFAMILHTKSISTSANPIFVRTRQIYDQKTLLQVFFMSNLMMTLLPMLGFLIWWTIS